MHDACPPPWPLDRARDHLKCVAYSTARYSLNSSHGTPEQRAAWIAAVREAAAAADVAVAVLVDLQGPRIRVGKLAAPRVLRAGETVVFAPEDVARDDELPTT